MARTKTKRKKVMEIHPEDMVIKATVDFVKHLEGKFNCVIHFNIDDIKFKYGKSK